MKSRFSRGLERWSEHTRDLPPLSLGQRVLVQNQHGAGKTAQRWDRSGTVIEDLGHNKYRIRVDGSGRVTDRNRQFLRKFSSVTPTEPGPSPTSQPSPPVSVTTAPNLPADIPEPSTPPRQPTPPVETDTAPSPGPPSPEEPSVPTLRRSARNPAPNRLFSPSQFDVTRTCQYRGGGEVIKRH